MCLKKRQIKSWKRTLNYVFWSKTHLIGISNSKNSNKSEVRFMKNVFLRILQILSSAPSLPPYNFTGVWLSVTASELRNLKSQSSSWCSRSVIYNAVRDAAHLCMFLQVWDVRQIISTTLLSFLTSFSNPHLHEALRCFSKPLATSGPPWRILCCSSTVSPSSSRYEPKAWRGVAYRKPLKPDPAWWKIDVIVQTSTSLSALTIGISASRTDRDCQQRLWGR